MSFVQITQCVDWPWSTLIFVVLLPQVRLYFNDLDADNGILLKFLFGKTFIYLFA